MDTLPGWEQAPTTVAGYVWALIWGAAHAQHLGPLQELIEQL
jgi:hypothetical protein